MAITTLETKTCARCRCARSVSEFHKDPAQKSGTHPYCKLCRSELAQMRHSANLAVSRARQRGAMDRYRARTHLYRQNTYAKTRYGKTGDELFQYTTEAMAKQNGRCAICGKAADVIGQVKIAGEIRLVIDHNHSTGQLRGLLCDKCNRALGAADENVETLKAMISYLGFWREG